ncbi:MAG: hypothetical protein QG620_532 [Patescibacteria group bacterium]|nr:hypothetical protein [Patescibacteria group bacterium]
MDRKHKRQRDNHPNELGVGGSQIFVRRRRNIAQRDFLGQDGKCNANEKNHFQETHYKNPPQEPRAGAGNIDFKKALTHYGQSDETDKEKNQFIIVGFEISFRHGFQDSERNIGVDKNRNEFVAPDKHPENEAHKKHHQKQRHVLRHSRRKTDFGKD